jgi:chloramphenicol 3-O-phosphotransferase
MRLIERESQLAALQQYAAEASRGQGRLVLISGEAGVGKSVLLEEFAQKLKSARWLWSGCDGLFTPAALGPHEISCMPRCYDSSATCKRSPFWLLKMFTGPTKQPWIS